MANQSSTPFDQGLFLVHLNRGREHFASRNFADAAEELEEAMRLRPQDDTVLNLLGLAYFKQEKYKEADATYRKLIDLNPDSPTLYFNLGLVCFKLGDLDRAEATFLKTLELKSDNQKTHFYLGNIYEKKKQYYNAIFQYRKAGANIMVKRVQEKIDRERPQERGESDFSVDTPPPMEARPTIAVEYDGDRTAPDMDLDKINVDHIDRRLFLSALEDGLFPPPGGGTPESGAPRPDTAEHEALSATTSPDVQRGAGETKTTSDTQETTLSPDEMLALASEVEEAAQPEHHPPATHGAHLDAAVDDTLAPTGARGRGATDRGDASDAGTTVPVRAVEEERAESEKTVPPPGETRRDSRLRLSEPILQDESLAEMARGKVPSSASGDLFSRRERRTGEGGRPPIAENFPSPRTIERAPDGDSDLKWQASGSEEPHVYARGRRKDDLFRYLENNLMEVNFSGKVFIKQGTIYSYSGNLTFWVKPQRDGHVPPLVIVSGTGKLLLTDRDRDISVLQIEDEQIFVEPSHLLACQETLTPRYAVVEKDAGGPGLHVLMIEGTGMLALSVKTNPLVLTVQQQYPVNVASSSLISWSGDLTPTIVEDEALAEIMLPGASRGINLRLEGEGRVMMEKNSRSGSPD